MDGLYEVRLKQFPIAHLWGTWPKQPGVAMNKHTA